MRVSDDDDDDDDDYNDDFDDSHDDREISGGRLLPVRTNYG